MNETAILKPNDLVFQIIMTVYINPGLTGRDISKILNREIVTTKKEVNQILYGNTRNYIFRNEIDDSLRPSWYLKNHIKKILDDLIQSQNLEDQKQLSIDSVSLDSEKYPDYLQLYPWQMRALDKWEAAGYKGVIEAVTGTGKTRVALAAIDGHFRKGWKTVVIVPTIDLQQQWVKVMKNDLVKKSKRNIRVGQLGGGERQSIDDYDVLIATSQSAYRHCLHEGNFKGLLIADECHRYGAEKWAKGLNEKFEHRIGLTATYERSDNGVEEYLNPYFNGVCYTLGYDEALADDVIANFKIAFIGFNFTGYEQKEYKKADNKCKSYRKELIEDHQVPAEPFGEFIREVTALSEGGRQRANYVAGYYLSSFNQRRDILSSCTHKIHGLSKLATAIKAAERSIIFTQTRKAAADAVAALKSSKIRAAILDSQMDRDERRNVLSAFEEGELDVIAAPVLLDEGIDVPAADLAIVVASSRNKRQMIQRMGRVLRKKDDGRIARIAILYIKTTSEDPKNGAHETYIDLICDCANEIKYFDTSFVGPNKVCDYLNNWSVT